MADKAELVSIASTGLSAQVDPLGAQLFALRDSHSQDLLWNGDPAIWASRAPILFPIVGELNQGVYRLDGQIFHLPRHGLARRRRFELVDAAASSACFRLSADGETWGVYPFDFVLDVEFSLAGETLTLAASISNQGESAMPASFGFHPAFLWPLPYGQIRSDHVIRFEQIEAAPIRRLSGAGLLMPAAETTPVIGNELRLTDTLFVDDVVIFDQLASRSLTYGGQEGPRLKIDFNGAPYLGLWTKPGAPFICIEPWEGVADPEGYAGDFRAKPGMMTIEPGATRRVAMSVTLELD